MGVNNPSLPFPKDFTILLCEVGVATSIPLPHSPSVYISKRCADHPESRDFVMALVNAARDEWLAAS